MGLLFGGIFFMTEEVFDSTPKKLLHDNNVNGIDEVQGEWELDELVDDLHREWSQHDGKMQAEQCCHVSPTSQVQNYSLADGSEQPPVTILQPVHQHPYVAKPSELSAIQQQDAVQIIKGGTCPWSLDWLATKSAHSDSNIYSSQFNNATKTELVLRLEEHGALAFNPTYKKIKNGHVKCSVGLIKRVARMLVNDRKEILKILTKHDRSSKARKGKIISKKAGTPNSDSSINSTTSVNKDLESWVVLHGKSKGVVDDVMDIGKTVGVQFKCDTSNAFNLLTREGRKEGCAAVGGEVVREGVGGF